MAKDAEGSGRGWTDLISSYFIICVTEWRCPLLGSLSASDSESQAMVQWHWQGKTHALVQKSAAVPILPPQILREPAWDRNRASAVRSRAFCRWNADKRRSSMSVGEIWAENWTRNLSNVKLKFRPLDGSKIIWRSGKSLFSMMVYWLSE
jgi:hypothetical protein